MYRYEDLRPKLFTDDGQRMLLAVRDNVQRLLKEAGSVRYTEAVRVVSGDSWLMIACMDRLVELGEIRPLEPGQHATQSTVYVGGSRR